MKFRISRKCDLMLYGAVALLLLVGVLILVAPAQADTLITVTTTADAIAADAWCSLREAVVAANTDSAFGGCPGGSGADTIVFDPGLAQPTIFVLTNTGANEDGALSGDLDIAGTLTISGSVIIDGNAADRVFEILPGARATISGLTIRNGNPGLANDGGGIKVRGRLTLSDSSVRSNQGGGISNNGGLLTLSEVQITNNSGGYGLYNQNQGALIFDGGLVGDNQGGGIYNTASTATMSNISIINNTGGGGVYNSGFGLTRLTLSHSLVSTNTAATGGGIYNEGIGARANINDTRISGNTATAGGGGVYNNGTMTLNGSTLDHNQARSGGGMEHFGGNLQLTNDTFSANTASDNGGGLYNLSDATLSNVTLSGNTASGLGTGGNIFNDTAQLAIRNSIVAHSEADGNCFNSGGFLNSLGYNLDSANTCGFGATGDITTTNPLLGPLQDNGGTTPTHALLSGSPAIDAGNPATPGSGGNACAATDQRGISRPQGAACDIGAYEFGEMADLSLSKVSRPNPYVAGGPITYTLVVTNAGPVTVTAITLTEDLPAAIQGASYAAGQGSFSSASGAWIGLSLVAGQSAVLTVSGVVEAAFEGVLQNTAIVTPANASDPVWDNNTAGDTNSASPQADLSLDVVVSPPQIGPGERLTYTLVISNLGPSVAREVALVNTLPVSVTFITSTITSTIGGGGTLVYGGGVMTYSLTGLAAGSSVTAAIVVTAPLSSRLITNTASVTSTTPDPNLENNKVITVTSLDEVPVEPFYKVYLPIILRGS